MPNAAQVVVVFSVAVTAAATPVASKPSKPQERSRVAKGSSYAWRDDSEGCACA